MARPVIGITVDLVDGRYEVAPGYADAVRGAGGTPVLLPCTPESAGELAALCDGLVLTGGGDPIMEHWGEPTHPRARRIDARRQAFELALLQAADERETLPVLGICLGMQLMGLHRGGALDQYLPESLPSAGRHWPRGAHAVAGALGEGLVHSHHRQALIRAGRLEVAARADDGVIEAVRDRDRVFYLGVQWHPERTSDTRLGPGVFEALVRAAR